MPTENEVIAALIGQEQREIRNLRERERLRVQTEQQQAIDRVHEQARAKEQQAQQDKARSDRERAAAVLESELQRSFFEKNPSATESEFKRLYPALRDDYFKRHSLLSGIDALRATGQYRI